VIWAWTCLLLFPTATLVAAANLPPWQMMCWLTLATLAGCKAATWTLVDPQLASPSRRLGYWLAWPGMDPAAFLLRPKQADVRPAYWPWIEAALMMLLGAVLIWGIVRWSAWSTNLAAWIAIAGLIFLGHFGLLELLSCAWRQSGINARPLMDHPWLATSLADFWGRRWNTAFRDLAYRLVLVPMTRRFGSNTGLVAVFLFSGVIHDFVISISARGGYGLPTLYFLIQGAATLLLRLPLAKRLGLDAGWKGWSVTMGVVFAPAGLLFHAPWRQNVILPLMEAIGAL
jgi:membrane bound O-acyltransferase family protein